MSKFSIDYLDLQNKLNKKRAFKLSEVKNRIKKVAFDVVRFVDSDRIDDLWQIHREGDDEYIIAMYEEDLDNQNKTASMKTWSVLASESGEHVNVYYNGNPVKYLSLAKLNIPTEDANLVCQSLSKKLDDQVFVSSFIKSMTPEERAAFKTLLDNK